VNKSGGYVKCKKSGQPKNNQGYGDHRKHVGYLLASEISYPEDEGLCHCEHFRIFIYIQSQVDWGNSGAVAANSGQSTRNKGSYAIRDGQLAQP